MHSKLFILGAVALVAAGSCFGSANLAAPTSVANTCFIEYDFGGASASINTYTLLENDGTFYDVQVMAHDLIAPPLRTGTYSYIPNADNTGTLSLQSTDGTSVSLPLYFTTSLSGDIGAPLLPGDPRSFTFSIEALATVFDLVNTSSRSLVGPSNPSTSGFVVSGSVPRYVLLRAVGPALSQFGVTDFAPSPSLQVFQGPNVVAQNSGWSSANGGPWTMSQAFARAGAFALPANSQDSAVVVLLQPGSYTAQASSPQLGEVLVELYLMP